MGATVALWGGWHWFGTSGVGLVTLWLHLRLGEALAVTGPADGEAVSLDLSQVVWMRVDPWRVTVVCSIPSDPASGVGTQPLLSGTLRFRRRRFEFFRDELHPGAWAELRRGLIEAAASK